MTNPNRLMEETIFNPLDTEPAPKPAEPTPITLIPQAAIMPRRYVVHLHSQVCLNCKTKHEWSATYAFNEMMTRTGAGKMVKHLVPITRIDYNLPIDVFTIEPRQVPVCHECASEIALQHLPDPRGTEEWKRTYQLPLYSVPLKPTSGAAPSTPKKAKPTLDELLDF